MPNKLKRISLESSLILLCLMEEMVEGKAEIAKGNERIVIEQLDSICNLGGTVVVRKDFVHEGKDFSTGVFFIITDDGQIPYRYTNNRNVDHMLIKIHKHEGGVCGCAVEYQEALRNFSNDYLNEMKDMVNLQHLAKLGV